MSDSAPLVLITGSSGLIGSRLVQRLADDYRIARFARHPRDEAPGTAFQVDLAKDASVSDGLAAVRRALGREVAAVIHLAAYYDFSGAPSPLYREVTIEGTRRLLRGLQEQDFAVGQFVFSSSMLVHAPSQPPDEIDEDDPLDPRWAYPRSKVKTEELIRDEHGDIPAVLARIAGIYDEWCHSIPLAHQIQRIYEEDPHAFLFPGDPEHGQSFLHVEDLVDALVRIVERRGALPELTTILLGEDEPLSYRDLQDRIGELIHGREWPTIRIPSPVAQFGAWLEDALPGTDPFIKPWMIELADDDYDLDIDRARALLGWEPRHGLGETLPPMIENLRSDPRRWYRENNLDPAHMSATAAR